MAGVSFDLFDSLYKPDAPKTTTVHVSDTRTDMLHCTATRWGLWLKHLAPDYKSIITPHYRALAVYARTLPLGATRPRASCTYTSQSTQWGVITNTYIAILRQFIEEMGYSMALLSNTPQFYIEKHSIHKILILGLL